MIWKVLSPRILSWRRSRWAGQRSRTPGESHRPTLFGGFPGSLTCDNSGRTGNGGTRREHFYSSKGQATRGKDHARRTKPHRPIARVSNGPTEAINNLIKRIKRVGFGFRNFENYRIRALIYAGKPNWRVLGSIVVR
jgi:hypothetical protein